MHNDFVALREESKSQDKAARELKQQGQQLKTAAGLVHAGLHDAQETLSRLDGIECNSLPQPDFSNYHEAVEKCSTLVRTLLEKKQAPVEDYEKLIQTVSALNSTVSRGVKSIATTLHSLRNSNVSGEQKLFEQFKQYVEDLQLSTLHVQHSEADKVRLEERLRASEVLMGQLRRSTEQAESHAKTFQKAIESTMNASDGQQNKFTVLETKKQAVELQCAQAKSHLALVEKELRTKEQEVGLVAELLLYFAG